MAKKTKKTTSYDLEKEVMLALVIRRPLRNRLERIIPEGETMRSFVTALIEKAVAEAATSQTPSVSNQAEKQEVPAASPAPELTEGYLPPLTAAKG